MNRTCLSLAVACALGAAGGALANPTGAEIVHGAATVNASGRTLIVVPTPGAIIDWRGFVIAPDETTRFVQTSPSATVLNRIGSTAFGLYGRVESNGRVLFMQSGQVFGDGIALDLPGITLAALRQPLPARAREVDFRAAGPAGRAVDPWVVMIVPESVPVAAGGGALLPSGVSAELVDARWPHVRVLITAPSGQALDVAQLVRKSGALGIFGSLLAVPRGQQAEGAEEPVQLARAERGAQAPSPFPLEEPPAIQESIQVAMRAEMPVPSTPAAVEEIIAAPVIASAEVQPPVAPVVVEDVVAAPMIALADPQPQTPVPPAAVEEIVAAPVIASAEVQPPVAPVVVEDVVAAPMIALADPQPQAPVLPAAVEEIVAAPVIALAEVQPPVAPVVVEDVVAAPVIALADPQPQAPVPPAAVEEIVAAPVIALAEVQPPVAPVVVEDVVAAPVIALADPQPQAPVPPAAVEEIVAAPVIVLAEVQPPVAPVVVEDVVAAPVIALADPQPQPQAPAPPAAVEEIIAAPVIALAEVQPPVAPVVVEDLVAAPMIAMADPQPQAPVLPAAVEEIVAAPVIALAEAPTTAAVEPLILAAVDTGTMHDGAAAGRPAVEAPVPVVPVAAAARALPQASAPAVSAEPPVIVASAEPSPESPVRRVALVASDTPVWPAPVKLERVERRMPVIMFDRKGGIFHL